MSNLKRRLRLAPFVPVTRAMLDLLVWKALSPGARLLYISLKRFLNEKIGNNGKIYLSYRDACEALGTRSSARLLAGLPSWNSTASSSRRLRAALASTATAWRRITG